MLLHREEYLNHMLGRGSSQELLVELFGPLIGLEEEWREQGATEAEISLDAFDFAGVDKLWVGSCQPRTGIEPRVLEDTATEQLAIDHWGRTTRLLKRTASIPLPEGYPVADEDDWQKAKPWFAFREDRVDGDKSNEARKRREHGGMVLVNVPGGYDFVRQLMGDEEACIAFIEEPELVEDMLQTFGDLATAVLDAVGAQVPIDQIHVHEDFAGRSGPLLGPKHLKAYVQPYYKRVVARAREHGAQLVSLDTDGNVIPIIDVLLDSGITQIYPMEPAAGMDIVALRERYGNRIIMKGGIDKHVLRKSKTEIEAELTYKLQPKMRGGGIAFGLDHRIPNGTPLENYRFYVQTAREMLGLPPAQTVPGSWRRMAW